MATITTRKASSRITYTGDINTNNGQLGLHANVSASSSYTIASPYYTSYNIVFTSATNNSTIVLPAINTTTGVRMGWKSRFLVTIPMSSIQAGSSQTLTIQNVSFTTIYIINCMANSSFSTPSRVSFVITALGPGISNYYIEYDTPSPTRTAMIDSHLTSNSGVQTKLFPTITKLYLSGAGTPNINVLSSTPVAIVFNTFSSILQYDVSIYTFSSPSTRITFVRSGSYYVSLDVNLSAAGGATVSNCVFAIRKNGGITTTSNYCTTNSSIGSFQYVLKGFITVAANDYIEITGGRTSTTIGTLTVNNSSVLNIICFGAS